MRAESLGMLRDYNVFMAEVRAIGHDKRGNTVYRRDEEGEILLFEPGPARVRRMDRTAAGTATARLLPAAPREDRRHGRRGRRVHGVEDGPRSRGEPAPPAPQPPRRPRRSTGTRRPSGSARSSTRRARLEAAAFAPRPPERRRRRPRRRPGRPALRAGRGGARGPQRLPL